MAYTKYSFLTSCRSLNLKRIMARLEDEDSGPPPKEVLDFGLYYAQKAALPVTLQGWRHKETVLATLIAAGANPDWRPPPSVATKPKNQKTATATAPPRRSPRLLAAASNSH